MQEETLEGAGHSGSRGEPASSQKKLELSIPFHAFLPLSPISYGSLLFHISKLIAEQWFYWSFYLHSVLCAGTEPWGPTSGAQPLSRQHVHPPWSCRKDTPAPSLCTFPPFRKLTGIQRHQSSTPPPAPGRTGQTLLL